MAGDGIGHIFQIIENRSNLSQITVDVLTADNGTLTLGRSFTTTLATNDLVPAADDKGNFYLQETSGRLNKFGPTASGAVVPDEVLEFGTLFTDMATDYLDNIYASQGTSILKFAPGMPSVTPTATMDISSTLTNIVSISAGSCGKVYAVGQTSASQPAFAAYSAVVDGAATPVFTVQNSGMKTPYDIFVDDSGDVTISDNDPVFGIFMLNFKAEGDGSLQRTNSFYEGLGDPHSNRVVVY
jgi:hypothetical protein